LAVTTWLHQLVLDHVADAERREKLSQWYTPPDLAKRMAELVDLRGKRVLEPSAGSGNLVRAALDAGASYVLANDIDPRNRETLVERFDDPVNAWNADFLTLHERQMPSPFHVALMNPPWDDGVHWKHIQHALKFAPVVVALAPLAMLEGAERKREFWSGVWLDGLYICSERPAFGPEGGKMPVACYVFRQPSYCDATGKPRAYVSPEREHNPAVRFW
jgi:predicted RNA methylase